MMLKLLGIILLPCFVAASYTILDSITQPEPDMTYLQKLKASQEGSDTNFDDVHQRRRIKG